ncbi:MAG: hypothetical protein WGN25_10200 [Candidatus Electrothrix sp. GW3-4]|uniref:hypothetical protein n=1 Tax=Candidatus Electrothrix sp. GW3-4 TaxID=3126740 RepID=UPI0030D1D45E
MKPAAFLELAEQAGVILSIGSVGKIKAKGGAEQVDRFAPLIREHKAELLAFLQSGSARRHESPLPFLDDQGRLRIPLDADDKYRYWQGGQSVFATLLELGASDKEIEAHIGPISTSESWRQWQKKPASFARLDFVL